MRFDLLSLKLFVIVCEQQSISRTADVERIAASAVSKRMSDLEAMVKTPLFLRSQKGLDMTPAAHDLKALAGQRLRTHGGLAESRVPFILNRPLNAGYAARAARGGLRNFHIFDFAINGAAA